MFDLCVVVLLYGRNVIPFKNMPIYVSRLIAKHTGFVLYSVILFLFSFFKSLLSDVEFGTIRLNRLSRAMQKTLSKLVRML